MGYRHTNVVTVEVENVESGSEDLRIFGPFTSPSKAIDFRDRLQARLAKDIAKGREQETSVFIAAYTIREPKVLAAADMIRELIEEAP